MSETSTQTSQRPQGLGVLLSLFGLLLAIIAASVIWVVVNADTGEARPWSKPAINGTEITVKYQAGCVDAKSLKVKETSTSVTLTMHVKEEDSCDAQDSEHTETAVLKGTFNDRQLIDGACLENEFRGTDACSIESHTPISDTGLKKKVADPESVTSTEPTALPSETPSAS